VFLRGGYFLLFTTTTISLFLLLLLLLLFLLLQFHDGNWYVWATPGVVQEIIKKDRRLTPTTLFPTLGRE
jgi:hypothetical protein